MDLFCVVFSAEMVCCVLEGDIVVKDVWHVAIVGVKLSGCMSAPPEVNIYVCHCQKGHRIYICLFGINDPWCLIVWCWDRVLGQCRSYHQTCHEIMVIRVSSWDPIPWGPILNSDGGDQHRPFVLFVLSI
jgi:hypothetical protein